MNAPFLIVAILLQTFLNLYMLYAIWDNRRVAYTKLAPKKKKPKRKMFRVTTYDNGFDISIGDEVVEEIKDNSNV